jgi:trigger factor
MLDALAEKISGLSGTKTNRIQLIEKYGGDAVKEEAVNDAVFDYIVSQIKVVETETTTAAN